MNETYTESVLGLASVEIDNFDQNVPLIGNIATNLILNGLFDEFYDILKVLDFERFQMLTKNERFLRALMAFYFEKKFFKQVKDILKIGKFSDLTGLVDVWDNVHYAMKEDETGAPLSPVNKFRLRQKFPPPRNINPSGKRFTVQFDEQARGILKSWMSKHLQNPYPSNDERADLAEKTGLTSRQVKTWFSNTRRRQRKNVEKNQNKEGNHHLLGVQCDGNLQENASVQVQYKSKMCQPSKTISKFRKEDTNISKWSSDSRVERSLGIRGIPNTNHNLQLLSTSSEEKPFVNNFSQHLQSLADMCRNLDSVYENRIDIANKSITPAFRSTVTGNGTYSTFYNFDMPVNTKNLLVSSSLTPYQPNLYEAIREQFQTSPVPSTYSCLSSEFCYGQFYSFNGYAQPYEIPQVNAVPLLPSVEVNQPMSDVNSGPFGLVNHTEDCFRLGEKGSFVLSPEYNKRLSLRPTSVNSDGDHEDYQQSYGKIDTGTQVCENDWAERFSCAVEKDVAEVLLNFSSQSVASPQET